jgi:transglutaminase-like putative cysteine protease
MQRVYLEPLDTPVLFGAPQPIAFEVAGPRAAGRAPIELEQRPSGEVLAVERHVDPLSGRTWSIERKNGLRYTVWSEEPRLDRDALLRDSDEPVSSPELARYLALPSDLPPRVAELARTITHGQRGAYAKAIAVAHHLQTQYRYTLDLRHDERLEPIDEFLFVTRSGHCEYFASSMAILLRSLGVPTRSVNGFYGGEWNQYGRYVAIRQGDAHSWVEVYVDGAGWITFDPTPPSQPGARGFMGQAAPAARHRRDGLVQVGDRVRPRQTGGRDVRVAPFRRAADVPSLARRLAASARASARDRRRARRRVGDPTTQA